MEKRDYYEILGVDKGVSEADLKRAYRTLAMKYHPDRNQNDPEAVQKMKEINEAYAVLSDPQKRQLYDTYGHAGLEGYTTADIFRGVDFESIFSEFGLDFGFGDIFNTFFGTSSRSGRRQKRKGSDLRYTLELTLEEVYRGVEKTIEIPRTKSCPACRGSGAREGGLRTCEHCRGTGQFVREQRVGFGVFRQISTCSHCNGTGKMVKEKCPECKGKGTYQEISRINISVPKGVDSGYTIKLAGEGESVVGGEPGDLYVVIEVKKHPVFERHGDDLYMTREVSMIDAALGAELTDIPSLNGNLKLEIPEGTQTGSILRLHNKGLPHQKGPGFGDLYVMVKVVTPQNLTDEQKKLLQEFARLEQLKNKNMR